MNAQYKKGFVYFICLVSAMGGLLFGYDWVVIGGAKPFYEPYFGITDDNTMRAVAMSVALLGCLVGAMIAGVLADKYGRKRLLIVGGLVFFFFYHRLDCYPTLGYGDALVTEAATRRRERSYET